MQPIIYCKPTEKGIHTFYLVADTKEYFLFRQDFRQGVKEYFGNGVSIDEAIDFSKSNCNNAVLRTMEKIPMYIRYIEKEKKIKVFTGKRKSNEKNIYRKKSKHDTLNYEDYLLEYNESDFEIA